MVSWIGTKKCNKKPEKVYGYTMVLRNAQNSEDLVYKWCQLAYWSYYWKRGECLSMICGKGRENRDTPKVKDRIGRKYPAYIWLCGSWG